MIEKCNNSQVQPSRLHGVRGQSNKNTRARCEWLDPCTNTNTKPTQPINIKYPKPLLPSCRDIPPAVPIKDAQLSHLGSGGIYIPVPNDAQPLRLPEQHGIRPTRHHSTPRSSRVRCKSHAIYSLVVLVCVCCSSSQSCPVPVRNIRLLSRELHLGTPRALLLHAILIRCNASALRPSWP